MESRPHPLLTKVRWGIDDAFSGTDPSRSADFDDLRAASIIASFACRYFPGDGSSVAMLGGPGAQAAGTDVGESTHRSAPRNETDP